MNISSMPEAVIRITGAKTHNLKNIDLTIPRGAITAIVGVSGAGKSSLAFDTIHAEGYTRYIESISPYLRQYLDKMEKPPVEDIEGLPPAIAFRHRRLTRNPRSIAATSLDLFDFLRLLYAKISDFFCPGCGQPVRGYSADEILRELESFSGETIHAGFPYRGEAAFLLNRGYYFQWRDGRKERIDGTVKHQTAFILIDSLKPGEMEKSRLAEAVDKALALGGGDAHFLIDGETRIFPTSLKCPRCGVSYDPPDDGLFSFNSPRGACPRCNGLGETEALRADDLLDPGRPLRDNPREPIRGRLGKTAWERILKRAERKGVRLDDPVGSLDPNDRAFILYGDGPASGFEGLMGFFRRLRERANLKDHRSLLERYVTMTPCPACNGGRLNPLARSFRIRGVSIDAFLTFTVKQAGRFIRSLNEAELAARVSPEVIAGIRSRLSFLEESGLHYLELNRPTHTLSRGEFQRVNLAFILGATLSDSLLIIDQPSSDLHPHDYEKLKKFLLDLRENGNTVLLVEHNRDIVAMCDYVVELGPMSGAEGGQATFCGDRERFFSEPLDAGAVARRYFRREKREPAEPGSFAKWCSHDGARAHNLKNISVRFPARAFTVIAGVSGAGKTSLLYDELYKKSFGARGGAWDDGEDHEGGGRRAIYVDPGREGASSLSSVASYFGFYAGLGAVYAGISRRNPHAHTLIRKTSGASFGVCPQCRGRGIHEIEMQFLAPVRLPCEHCRGTGFEPEALTVLYKGKNIRQTLDSTINDWLETAETDLTPKDRETLANLKRCGLGGLRPGQPLNTLSSGEFQRVKLARALASEVHNALFLLDEPSFGLHEFDLEMVVKLICRLIDAGNTVVAAEHNLSLIARAHYMIELGPEGGENGGQLIYQGPVADALNHPESLTGYYLKKFFQNT